VKRNTNLSRRSDSHARVITVSVCLFLFAIVWGVFGQTLRHEFVNYDDDRYVYKNPRTANGFTLANVRWVFSHSQVANWHPLTMISHMLDCQLYDLQPWGHHLTNVLLHATAAVLLFLALRSLTSSIQPSILNLLACAFAATLFAIHPLRVESVAWVSERKDVLSGVFFMLTLLAYARYARGERSHIGSYLAVIVPFALGLMCKPTLVTTPFVLLLLDYWPLERWPAVTTATTSKTRRAKRGARDQYPSTSQPLNSSTSFSRLVLEKIPLFALSAVSCAITIFAQTESFAMLEGVTFHQRFTNAIVAYVQYLGQTIYPAHLAVLYPYPTDRLETVTVLLSLLFLLMASISCFYWRKRFPFLLVGWLWFLGMLVPMIGLVQVGSQARADRYTYLPAIGLYVLAAWGALALSVSLPYGRRTLAAASVLVIAALATRSYSETSYWRDSETLWSHTIANTSNNAIAENNLATLLLHKGKVDQAIAETMKALATAPGLAEAEGTLGNGYLEKGDTNNAIAHYQRAIELRPEYAEVQSNLGNVLLDKGDIDQAIVHYHKALSAQPDYAGVHCNLGNALLQKGDESGAIMQYEQALEIDPNLPDAYNNLGNAFLKKSDLDAAIVQWQKAVALKPDFPEAQYNLGIAFAAKGNYRDAIMRFTEALRLRPDYAAAKDRLRELGASP
jgi:protein O-mannosyl-transferase